jgi:HAD superfamily hydrolase (TIGR01509 family)
MSSVYAVILDLDGVLWSSNAAHARAYREALAPLGIPFGDYSAVAGRRTADVMRALLAEHGIEPTDDLLQRVVSAKQLHARAELAADPPLVNGCRESLEALRRRFRLALASSSSPENVGSFLAASRGRSLFDVVIDGSQVALAKPDPEIYRLALQRLGLPPDGARVVEDSLDGVAAGAAAGIRAFGIVGTCTGEQLREAGASRSFQSLPEAAEYIIAHH